MSDETTPSADLRERVADALSEWTFAVAGGRPFLPRDQAVVRENSLARADVVLAAVQPEIDQLRKRAESAERMAASAMETVGRLQQDERTTELLRKQQEERAEKADATVRQYEDLLASIVLYIKWRYVTKQLTTEQKDLFADSLERHAIRVHGPGGEDPDSDMARLPSYAPRWWREDHAIASDLDQPADSKES